MRWGIGREDRERLGLALPDVEAGVRLPPSALVAADSASEDGASLRWVRVAGAWRVEVDGAIGELTERLLDVVAREAGEGSG